MTVRDYLARLHARLWSKHLEESEMDVIRGTAAILHEAMESKDAHCATCQCNRTAATPPVPGNPQSKSWHDNG